MSGQTNAMEWMDALLYLMKRIILNVAWAGFSLITLISGIAAAVSNLVFVWSVVVNNDYDWEWLQIGAVFGGIAVVCLVVSVVLFAIKKQPTDDKASIED
jgi:hypothetical protein